TALATDRVFEMADELVAKVMIAARAPVARLRQAPRPQDDGDGQWRARARDVDVVVIGVSTGGPQALKQLIPRLPADFPVPMLVVLHMPVGYTELYARRLGEISALSVSEAREGDPVSAGSVLVAPAGRHLSLLRNGNGSVQAHL